MEKFETHTYKDPYTTNMRPSETSEPGSLEGFTVANAAPDNSIIRIMAPDGRSSAVYIEDGVLVHRGDLPTSDAARIFLESMGDGLESFNQLMAELNSLRTEVAELRERFSHDGQTGA